jgi:hypothetical protein
MTTNKIVSLIPEKYPVQTVDMSSIKLRAKGNTHFFDTDSMRFFDSRISVQGYQVGRLVFFVTSERFEGLHEPDGPRLYSVRMINLETWRIDTYPSHEDGFQAHPNGRAAHKAAQEAALKAGNLMTMGAL